MQKLKASGILFNIPVEYLEAVCLIFFLGDFIYLYCLCFFLVLSDFKKRRSTAMTRKIAYPRTRLSTRQRFSKPHARPLLWMLPNEIMMSILKRMHVKDLLNVCCVSLHFAFNSFAFC